MLKARSASLQTSFQPLSGASRLFLNRGSRERGTGTPGVKKRARHPAAEEWRGRWMWVELSPPTEGRSGQVRPRVLTVGGTAPAGKSGISGSSPNSATNLLSVFGQLVSLSVLHLQKGWPR